MLVRRGPANDQQLWPRGLHHAVACFDPVDAVLLLVGMSQAGDRTELWEWNGFRWRMLMPLDGITPPPLIEPAAVYHEATGRLVLFGGTLPGGVDSNRTWLWNGGFWDEPFFQDVPPAPMHGAGMTYSRSQERLVLFGGERDGHPIDETWMWGLGGWRLAASSLSPPAQRGANRLISDSVNDRILLCDLGTSSRVGTGTWLWGPSGWEHANDSPVPDSHSGLEDPAAFDVESSSPIRLITDASDGRTQRWVWNAANRRWTLDRFLSPSLQPNLRDVTSTTDTRRKKVLILGRRGETGDLELWEETAAAMNTEVSKPELEYGSNTNAYVLVRGDGPWTYQWLRDGSPLTDDGLFEGTQSASLAIDAPRLRCESFSLACRVCGPCGCATSEPIPFRFTFVSDFNIDGGVDGADVEAFLEAWQASSQAADVNCDGGVDGADLQTFFLCWQDNCG